MAAGRSGAVVLGTPALALDAACRSGGGSPVPVPPRPAWTWPQRLQAAVLALALEDLTGSDAELAADARRWLAAEADERPFDFRSVCTSLGLDPGAVRRAVAARQPKPLSPRRAAWLAARSAHLPDVVLDGA